MNELYRIFCLKPSLPRQGNPNQEGFYATILLMAMEFQPFLNIFESLYFELSSQRFFKIN